MKKLLILATFAILLVPFSQCRKESSNNQFADLLLIQKVKRFFTDSIAAQKYLLSTNPRIASSKYPLWDSARVLSTTAGNAVVVPIIYNHSLHLRSTIAGEKLFIR